MNPQLNCSNCKFFNGKGSEARGVPAPRAYVLHTPEVEPITNRRAIRATSYWPPIGRGEWCGEHEPDFFVEEPQL